jgi:hypothetical protein
MKIVCAAICKNEEHNVLSLIDNLHEYGVHDFYVIDTGSTDNTIALLKSTKKIFVKVKQIQIEPFDFSAAKNSVMDILPNDADFVLHLDFDERIKNWPSLMIKGHGYSCLRKEVLYDMISTHMLRLTPRLGWNWTHPIHECIIANFPVRYDPNFVIEHHQKPNKDCYENLTEYWYKFDSQRLYPHRLTDLVHNKLYNEYVELFELHGTWNLTGQAEWRVVKNYILSCLAIQHRPKLEYISKLENYPSTSTFYYLSLAYYLIDDRKMSLFWKSRALNNDVNRENQILYYNKNIESLVNKYIS